MGLFDWLLGSTERQGTPNVQPNLASVGAVDYRVSNDAPIVCLEQYETHLMATSPVGYSVANPVFIQGLPPSETVTSVPQTKISDAPQKRCN
jgi:hypothetical protein